MRRRVSCPLMIGRADELGRLRDALAAAEAGAPLTDGLLPYAPVVELLRALDVDGVDQEWLSGLPEADRAVLVGFLPDRAGPLAGSGDADQYRVLAALRRLLDRLATPATLVVVLEDLHWADPSTLALVSYLVHGRPRSQQRLLLIGTYRSDELSSRHPLRSLLAELDRAHGSRIELARLAPAETAAQIAGVLNAVADPRLVERMQARCDGNPFLIEELLAAGPTSTPCRRAPAIFVVRQ